MRGLRFTIIGFVACVSWVALAAAMPTATRTYPLPVDIEGKWVRSSLYIRVLQQDYNNETLGRFQARTKDAEEQVLANLLEAIRTKNYLQAATALMLSDAPNQPSQSNLMGLTLNQVVDLHHAMLGGLVSGSLIARIALPTHSLFILDLPNSRSPQRTAFIISSTPGRPVAKFLDDSTPVDLLIVQVFNEQMASPSSYKALEDINLPFRQELKGKALSRPTRTPVLLFDGVATSANLAQASSPGTEESVNVIRSARQANANDNMEKMAATYTAPSAQGIAKFRASLTKPQLMQYGQMQKKNEFARFVIKANPVDIVFYSERDDATWRSAPLRYYYVVRDAGGAMRVANFGYLSYLDQVLNDPTMFSPGILRGVVSVSR